MTRDDTAARVRVNLEDAAITFYSNIDINDSIQDGYNFTVGIAQPIERLTSNILFENKKVYYDLSIILSRYIRPMAIYNRNIDRWLDFKDLLFLDSLRTDWELTRGESYYVVVLDHKQVALNPTLVIASGGMDIFYKASAETLTETSTPEIPETYETILEEYATADLLEQAEEYEKAKIFWDKFYNKLKDLKLDVEKRSLPDRIYMLREQEVYG